MTRVNGKKVFYVGNLDEMSTNNTELTSKIGVNVWLIDNSSRIIGFGLRINRRKWKCVGHDFI